MSSVDPCRGHEHTVVQVLLCFFEVPIHVIVRHRCLSPSSSSDCLPIQYPSSPSPTSRACAIPAAADPRGSGPRHGFRPHRDQPRGPQRRLVVAAHTGLTPGSFYPAGEKGSSPSLNSRIWGRDRPTTAVFWCADWRTGDSRLIGAVAKAPMKTPLAQAVRFFERQSAHTAPCF
jgi:hypothetical protein